MVDLLIDQIEFCDVIILNKVDLINEEEKQRLFAILNKLNPRAKIEVSEFGQVNLDNVLIRYFLILMKLLKLRAG